MFLCTENKSEQTFVKETRDKLRVSLYFDGGRGRNNGLYFVYYFDLFSFIADKFSNNICEQTK